LANYTIRDLEKLSGIKAHTIRIWEQRYNLIEPKRSTTNIRYYTDEDLQFVMHVSFLNRNGLRISKISKMTREEIVTKVHNISKDSFESSNQIQSLTIAMIELHEEKINQILDQSIQQNGFDETLQDLVIPFLEKLSLLWIKGSLSHVHEQFSLHLIKSKIHQALGKIKPSTKIHFGKPNVLLFEPVGEDQEVNLLIVNYLLKSRGCKTSFLSKGIQMNDLKISYPILQPQLLITTVSDQNPKNKAQVYLNRLSNEFQELQIIALSKNSMKHLLLPDNVYIFEDFNDVYEFIDELN